MASISQTCKIDGCERNGSIEYRTGKTYFIKGYCRMHYTRLLKYGDLNYSYYTSRPHIQCDGYIKIPTNKSEKYLLLDNDFKNADNRLWAVDSSGYAISNNIRAHVLVMGKQKKGFVIDHINGDKLDNRRSNLRVCTHANNLLNTGANKASRVGYKGVWTQIYKSGNITYAAVIGSGKKRINLGTYKTPVEAARAYDRAAKEIHGEFAYQNFPTS